MNFQEGEILIFDKPLRWTSFDVVNNIRAFLKYNAHIPKLKVGHAGTLDPLATGVLIICTGKYTKRIEEFQAFEKEYTGTFTLGATTPCYDLEKEIDQHYDISHITPTLIYETVKKFIGDILQIPPTFSAIKIDGKRAYKYARNDEEVKIQSKQIYIKEFEITKISLPEVHFRIVCSKGTYIRAIARDLGKELNSGAYLSKLCRTRIGEFTIDKAISIDSFKEALLLEFSSIKQ
ncbi:MAG: tRNA pseudouridine(55) synthase TruB [Bacteroidota bacterium]